MGTVHLVVFGRAPRRGNASFRTRTIYSQPSRAGVRAHADLRDNQTPGAKYAYWELRGAALRLELGPKDMAAGAVMAVRRDSGGREAVAWGELAARVPALLEEMQAGMLASARERVAACRVTVLLELRA
jgi:prolyl-tRNA synthetase